MQRLTDERGAVGVMVALLMVPLMGLAALAIDVSAMYAERQQLQNGADAAALAVAQDCAAGSCGKSRATVRSFAAANVRVGASSAAVTSLTQSQVTVSNSGVRDHLFAPVLGIDSTFISTTATAEWSAPTGGTASLPLTFNRCAFDAQTGGRLPSSTVQRTISFAAPSGSACASAGPAAAGAVAWVEADPGTCRRTSALTGPLSQLPASPITTNEPPSSCAPADVRRLQNTTVLVPVFDTYAGTAPAAAYGVEGYAAFKITGYYFGGRFSWGSPCGGSDRCIRGYFTRKADRTPTFTYGAGAPQLGAGIVTLTE